MNKLITLLTLLAFTLPMGVFAQPDDGPRERPDRERGEQRDRSDRPGDRGRPGDREGDRDRSGNREPLSPEQIEEAIATIRAMHGDAEFPWLQRIEAQLEKNPEEAAKRLARFPRLRELMDARQNRPKEFALQSRQGQLMREVFPMVRELRQAQANEDQAKVDELKPQIRERIKELFEIRMAMKEYEIKRMRDKLAKAEDELAEIQADSESLIDEKMNDILAGKGPRGPREDGDRPDRDGRSKPDRDD